jgi:eukaryotic-like serine/threonine-protein kinase
MELKSGAKLGPYEIVVAIGKGGMGEVWKARDPRLGRDVAIKVSAQQFTDRFEREARAIAALNHKNICTLFDVGPNYLVMELIEGPTLAERIAEGPIPLEEALAIARQIADALEAAHEKNIVHRDLKPANIKVKPDGSVKVLDFGLAKSAEAMELTSDSPTMLSVAGTILGTAAYMAPEQARGKPTDKRADIFAFAIVLHEMVTGKRLFGGEDASEMLAKVIRDEPDISAAPPRIHKLLVECLRKDPSKRLRDIGDVWRLLDDASPAPAAVAATAAAPQRFQWLWPAAAAVLLLSTGALAFVHFREAPPALAPMRFEISPPPKTTIESFNLSPDGRKLVFHAGSADGHTTLWLRAMDSLQVRELPGTQGAILAQAWSPDSQFIAFEADGNLKKIDISGGNPQILAPYSSPTGGISWSRQDVILFMSGGTLRRIPASGGEAVAVTALDSKNEEVAAALPVFLPDGKHFFYYRILGKERSKSGIFIGSLDAKPAEQGQKRLLETPAGVAYMASARGGNLLFLRGETLMSQPFDPSRLELTGSAVQLADRVSTSNTYLGLFSVSNSGVLGYGVTGSNSRQLTWFDREGKVLGHVGEAASRDELSLSPDGTRVAEGRVDQNGNWVVWGLDLARSVNTRLTFENGGAGNGTWSPDGSQIIYAPGGGSSPDLYRKPANGAGQGELLFHSDVAKQPLDWSRDGRFLLFAQRGKTTGSDLWVLPMEGDRKPSPYLATPFEEGQAKFSPDGHWVVYTSNESGTKEVYVQPFPLSTGGKWPISNGGGSQPRWGRDGKELFYFTPDSTLMAVSVTTNGATFQPGVPKPLFRAAILGGTGSGAAVAWRWDVSPDGKRFLMNTALEETPATPVTIVLNWQSPAK